MTQVTSAPLGPDFSSSATGSPTSKRADMAGRYAFPQLVAAVQQNVDVRTDFRLPGTARIGP